MMKVLCIGDIVGKPGREAVEKLLKPLKEELAIDFVIANAENTAGGAGISSRLARFLLNCGCDVLTMGDHIWDQKELEEYLGESDRILRPANFPEGAPGKGYTVIAVNDKVKIAVVNLLGRVFIRYAVDCPFKALEKIVQEISPVTPNIFVDIHAEATSEKVALGHFADGKVSGVFGTHTHIQTADEKVLPQQTAYITDLGMTGPYDSVIGQKKEHIIQRFLTSMPVKFSVAESEAVLHGVIIEFDETTGKAHNITRIQRPVAS